jgi:hypothetical protein
MAYKTTLINSEKGQKLRRIGTNADEVLAVRNAFMYGMHWRKNVRDALSARTYSWCAP